MIVTVKLPVQEGAEDNEWTLDLLRCCARWKGHIEMDIETVHDRCGRYLMASVPKKHVILNVEYRICRTGHFCSFTTLHLQKCLITHFTFIKKWHLRFGSCSWPYCDFDSISIKCSPLL